LLFHVKNNDKNSSNKRPLSDCLDPNLVPDHSAMERPMLQIPTTDKSELSQNMPLLPLDYQEGEIKRLEKKCAELHKSQLFWQAYSKGLSAIIDDFGSRYPGDQLFQRTGRILPNGAPEQALHAIFTTRFLSGPISGGHQQGAKITTRNIHEFFVGRKYQLALPSARSSR
jgi:hypothetical protein